MTADRSRGVCLEGREEGSAHASHFLEVVQGRIRLVSAHFANLEVPARFLVGSRMS